MKLNPAAKTCIWLWCLLSVALFVIGGFIDFVPEWDKSHGAQYWKTGREIIESGQPLNNFAGYLTVFGAAIAIPAIAIAWVLQALGVLLCKSISTPIRTPKST